VRGGREGKGEWRKREFRGQRERRRMVEDGGRGTGGEKEEEEGGRGKRRGERRGFRGEGKRTAGEDAWRKFEEKRERVRRERERKELERKEREREVEAEKRRERRRNIVWRGVEGDSTEERKRVIEGIVKEELGRKVEIREVRERRGSAGIVLITCMGRVRDKKDLLERGWEIRRNWGVGVDEDLSMEERRVRWKLVERARAERARGKTVVTTNRRIWIDGKAWGWDLLREEWYEETEETEEESDG